MRIHKSDDNFQSKIQFTPPKFKFIETYNLGQIQAFLLQYVKRRFVLRTVGYFSLIKLTFALLIPTLYP